MASSSSEKKREAQQEGRHRKSYSSLGSEPVAKHLPESSQHTAHQSNNNICYNFCMDVSGTKKEKRDGDVLLIYLTKNTANASLL